MQKVIGDFSSTFVASVKTKSKTLRARTLLLPLRDAILLLFGVIFGYDENFSYRDRN